ncbi:hypothetical protein [Alkalihalobacterium chitinilyticum]|uniref:Uncharacterized protein n=1 Tax=Alkalihalobacterium chitinilyticum TaxID=2980103 RepID=A0ABT5VB94_9BACI|nr:hypothetical protein [Alkalihalobacterium chitinilyticum]MDE5412720.1 hypothetical protein [Alkalihalobacterium chitinilyticum]
MKNISDKWGIVEVKLKCIRLLSFLEYDEIYTKEHAANEMRKIIELLDEMDEELCE